MKADLHCHSTASDGTLTPTELIKLAKEQGLFGISITDHDTLEAYKTAAIAAKTSHIRLGTGIEFSCEYEGSSIHILGYDYNLLDSGIIDLCDRHQKRRIRRNEAILEQLEKKKIFISQHDLLQLGSTKTLGRPHIAEQMVRKGYVSSIQEAFNKYLGEGKSCYVPGASFSIPETIDIIHQAQGKAFLAHPHLLPRKISTQSLLKLPFDGIEAFYCRFSQQSADPWIKIAQEKGWLISGGSDFHGAIKPEITLGCSYVGQEEFEKIFTHFLI